jgi:Tfp pilus assembly protein PilE
VELLVVIAIIGILVSLLLPAVQAARESARRTQCLNNMRQIGLALHNYHDTLKFFPASNITPGNCCSTEGYGNWCLGILPYVEGGNVLEQYKPNLTNQNAANAYVRTFPMKVYMCPSDVHAGQINKPETGPGYQLDYMTGSYRAMGGKYDGNTSKWDTGEGISSSSYRPEWRGVMHIVGFPGAPFLKHEQMASITDGTSNTTMIAEYATRPGNRNTRRANFWAYSYASYVAGCATDQSRTLINDFERCIAIGGTGGEDPCKRAFASFHPGGLQITMCDASTRFISKQIDLNVWTAMATISGGETAASQQ